MSLMASPWAIRLRSFARKTGFNRLLGRFFARDGYEARFSQALRHSIRNGDCVWDVGANLGWYTEQLVQWVGPRGQVFAFEPDPQNVARLFEKVAASANVVVLPIGLSDRDGQAALRPGDDQLHATSMIVPNPHPQDRNLHTVDLMSGDSVIANGRAHFPNVIKIDVEGHEFEVLQGMASMLGQSRLRSLFIEIHFATLEKQGRGEVPSRIESLLKARQFKVLWLDPSHLHASH